MTAFVANTNILELQGLKDAITEAFVNDAAVQVTLEDDEGNEVSGPVSWPLEMDYVAGSDGDYRVALSAELPLTPGDCYVAHIGVDAGVDRIGNWQFRFRPVTRVR